MKRNFIIILICLISFSVKAQSIKPYLATVKTLKGKQKGILLKVDSANVILNSEQKNETINISDIKWIKLRVLKETDQEFIKFINYDPWAKDNFEVNKSGVAIRKWGEKDPTLGEEIGGHIVTAAINITGNLLAAPIQSINPSIANFKIGSEKGKYLSYLSEISYYSVYYQSNPNTIEELSKLKKISANFKP